MGIWDDIKMGFGGAPKTQDYRDRTAATMANNSRNSEAMRGMGQRAQDANAQRVSDRYMSQTSNGGRGGILGGAFSKDPRARDRSTFRNPGKQEGFFGYDGFLRPKTGNVFTDLNRFMPMGLIAGAINSATTKPVDSGASYTMNTQRGVGPGTGTAPRPSPQQRLSGYAAPQVDTSYLNDQPPVMPMTSMSPLNFTNTEEDTFFDLSQPDSAFSGVPPSQRPGAVTGTVSDMGPLMDDLPLGPQSFLGGAIDAPADFFASADGGVSVDDAEFQEWLATNSGKQMQQWEESNPGFARRMYDTAKRIKAGKF